MRGDVLHVIDARPIGRDGQAPHLPLPTVEGKDHGVSTRTAIEHVHLRTFVLATRGVVEAVWCIRVPIIPGARHYLVRRTAAKRAGDDRAIAIRQRLIQELHAIGRFHSIVGALSQLLGMTITCAYLPNTAVCTEVHPRPIPRPCRYDLIAAGASRQLRRRAAFRVDRPDVPMTISTPGVERNCLSVGRPAWRALPRAGPVRHLLRTRPVCR